MLNDNGREFRAEGYITDLLTDYACRWLTEERDRSKPFAMCLWHKAVHMPFKAAPRHEGCYADQTLPLPPNGNGVEDYTGKPAWQKYKKSFDRIWEHDPEWNPHFEQPLDILETLRAVDESIGTLYATLERTGELDNTIILFASDNGYFMGEHGYWDKRIAYEESMRIPMIVRYPHAIAAGSRIDEMCLNIDIAPTLLEMSGTPVPDWMQGRSLVPLLRGDTTGWRRSFLFEYFVDDAYPYAGPTMLAVRTDRYKLVDSFLEDDIDELYDLQEDPGEMHNLIAEPQYDSLRQALRTELERLKVELKFNPDRDFHLREAAPAWEAAHADILRERAAKAAKKGRTITFKQQDNERQEIPDTRHPPDAPSADLHAAAGSGRTGGGSPRAEKRCRRSSQRTDYPLRPAGRLGARLLRRHPDRNAQYRPSGGRGRRDDELLRQHPRLDPFARVFPLGSLPQRTRSLQERQADPAGHSDLRLGAARRRLHHGLLRQVAPRRQSQTAGLGHPRQGHGMERPDFDVFVRTLQDDRGAAGHPSEIREKRGRVGRELPHGLVHRPGDSVHRGAQGRAFLRHAEHSRSARALSGAAALDTMYPPRQVELPATLTEEPRNDHFFYNETRNKIDRRSGKSEYDLILRNIRRDKSAYLGEIKCIDDNVGRIISYLKQAGLYDRTIIVFTADHGDMMGEHARMAKAVPLEASARIPFIVRYPKLIPAGSHSEHVASCIDFYPTILELTGTRQHGQVSGHSLARVLEGRSDRWDDAAFLRCYASVYPWVGIVTPEYKLIYGEKDPNGKALLIDRRKDPGELYNCFDDPAYSRVIRELTERIVRYCREHNDPHGEWLEKRIR